MNIWNWFRIRRWFDEPEDTLATSIAGVIKENLKITFNDEILVYAEPVGPHAVEYVVEYLTPKGMPGYDVFITSDEATSRFLEVLDDENRVDQTQSMQEDDDGEYFDPEEIQVLRQIFSRMDLANGRTVQEELAQIEKRPYVLGFKPKPGEIVMDRDAWDELVRKIHAIAGS